MQFSNQSITENLNSWPTVEVSMAPPPPGLTIIDLLTAFPVIAIILILLIITVLLVVRSILKEPREKK